MLSVVMLSVAMLSVAMLSVVMLSAVMLSVVAPQKGVRLCAINYRSKTFLSQRPDPKS